MIRFAVWSAVSTLEQVEGASLENQRTKSVERGLSEGWIDTGLSYVADGYSRTGYVNLSDAERDIPPLAEMLADMQAGKFDVLICWNYDRFGDLIIPVATAFRNNHKQLFSLSQPTPITENYNPYMDDSAFVMQAFAPIWDKLRKADIQRKYKTGMPKRIKEGYAPLKIPYGYKWTGTKEPPEQVPAEVNLLQEFRRMLFAGRSMGEMARHANSIGLPPPSGKYWHVSTIAYMLANPFYCGLVQFGSTRVINDKQIKADPDNLIIGKGIHVPLWSEDERLRIVGELERRKEWGRRYLTTLPLSGLLYCGVCGAGIHRARYQHNGQWTAYLRDDIKGGAHYRKKYDAVLPHIAQKIQDGLIGLKEPRENVVRQAEDYDAILSDLYARRKRVQSSAELGVYTPAEAAERVAEIKKIIQQTEARRDNEKLATAYRDEFLGNFDELEAAALWIQHYDPKVVNRLLHTVIKRVLLWADGRVEIEWR